MALIKCPECGQEVSLKADRCPHCGYQLHQWKENDTESGNMAIASMILGILSIILSCILIGFVLAPIAFILGVVALVQHKGGTGMAIAGIATSSIVIILLFLAIIGSAL